MKTVLSVILFAAFVASSSAIDLEAWCRCAAFATYNTAQNMVWDGGEVPVTSCDRTTNECRDACAELMNAGSDNGDLWYVTETGTTVGQQICDSLIGLDYSFIRNHYIYGYFEVCGGPWEYAEVASQQKLCCTLGGQHDHCIA